MTSNFSRIDIFSKYWIDESIFWHYHRLCNQLNVVTESITVVSTQPVCGPTASLLNEYVEPNINLVAEAIARNYGWTIAPTGETSLNLLGISTQVTSHYEFISSGPYRKYCINGITISFSHRVDKDFTGMSYKTKLLTQAIKTIGKEKINDYIYIISNRLTEEDKQVAFEEAKRTTAWVYEVIKELKLICIIQPKAPREKNCS